MAWFILPIRTGFPASLSLGGGKIRRTNMGHVAPMGPAYNNGWNRAGESADYALYSPRVLRIAYAPISPFTGLHDGWGIFNLPIALGALIPGVQVALAQLTPWVTGELGIFGAPPAKSFYSGALPRRFTSAGGGMYAQFGDDRFARLLPMRDNATINAMVESGAHIDTRTLDRRPNMGSRIWLTLHYGDKWSIENLFAMDTTELRYQIRDAKDSTVATVRGRMSSHQLSAGLRYNTRFINDNLSWYFFGGYSWLHWRVDQVTLNGAPLGAPSVRGGHDVALRPFKRIWPNGMYGGLGLEMFAPRRAWILGRLGYGLRAEVSGLAYPIHGYGCSCLAKRGDAALSLQFGW